MCDNKTCDFCFKKSFASCEKSKYWSNKNIKTPREVCKNSNKKYKFNCPVCNQIYTSELHNG